MCPLHRLFFGQLVECWDRRCSATSQIIPMWAPSIQTGSLKMVRLTLTWRIPNCKLLVGVEGVLIPNAWSYAPRTTCECYKIFPGRHFAFCILFLMVVCTLTMFDISKCLDEDGNLIILNGKYSSGGSLWVLCGWSSNECVVYWKDPSHPLLFRSDIKPWSKYALLLIGGL